ncbi:potassium channel kat1, partial [Phtheirospermum japonicum]
HHPATPTQPSVTHCRAIQCLFGEIGVLFGKPQPFVVRTTEISQILRLNKTTFLNFLQANPEDERIVMNNLFLVKK